VALFSLSGQSEPVQLPRLCAALRNSFARGYSASDLRADVLAGAVVGVVALPLSMALAIATGVPPQHGLYTAIVAGALIALLGGSKVQVSGPTAAFVAILAPIALRFGLGGLLVATLLAGLMQAAMGLARIGRLIQLIPYPVTIGFTAGIAIVIATLQIKDFLGLTVTGQAEHYLERLAQIVRALPSLHPAEFVVGAGTLLGLNLWPRLVTKRVPAPLVALTLAALAVFAFERLVPEIDVVTVRDRFTYAMAEGEGRGIPQVVPAFDMPWHLPGPDGEPLTLTLELLRSLLGPAFAIAMLGAIESLLSAVVADGMTGKTHDPDAELFAQGIGNVVAPFFGGIPATGAIARTATNVRSGARSPIAALVHSGVVLAAVLSLAPLLGYLPMASLAALLLLVAWNMGEARHVWLSLRTSPHSDSLVLVTCLGLTVVFDMVIAVGVGLVLASLLFMRRMIEISEVKLLQESHPSSSEPLPSWIAYYEIAGPLFFGAAHRAMSVLHRAHTGVRVVVLDLAAVPVIDSSGLVNLRSALARLHADGLTVVLSGVRPDVREVLDRAGLIEVPGRTLFAENARHALERAQATVSVSLTA
jgi:sulfate permease, SulP family